MRKFLALSALLCGSALAAGCDGDKSKVETERTYETTVAKPATVTEKHTTEVEVDEHDNP